MTPKPLRKGTLQPCSQCQRLTLVSTPERHVCERCKHPYVSDGPLVLRKGQSLRDWGRTQHLDLDDKRVVLINNMVTYLHTLKGQEIVRRWPWVWDGVAKIERELSDLTFEQVRSRINSLLKRLCYARGKRGRQNSGCDAPYRQDESFGQDAALRQKMRHKNAETNTTNELSKGEPMAIFVETPQAYELIDRGEYSARISAISAPEQNKFDPEKQSIKVTFELTTGGPFEGQQLTKYYTLSLSKMAGLGKLWRSLKGKLEPSERVDLEQLIGCLCAVQVTHKIGDDDEPYAVIQDVFQPAKTKTGKPKEPALAGAEVPF